MAKVIRTAAMSKWWAVQEWLQGQWVRTIEETTRARARRSVEILRECGGKARVRRVGYLD